MRSQQIALLDPAINLQQGLVGYWAYEGGSGSSVADSTNLGNTGTWNGTLGSQWTTGILGGGGNFNGSDNYVNVPSTSALNVHTGEFGVSGWIQRPAAADTVGNLISKDTGNGNNGDWYIVYSGGTITFRLIGTSSVQVSLSLSGGAWHHVVATVWHGLMSLWVDLTHLAIGTAPTGIVTTSAAVRMGGNPLRSQLFKGQLDEIGIWNRTIQPAEIRALYNNGAGKRAI